MGITFSMSYILLVPTTSNPGFHKLNNNLISWCQARGSNLSISLALGQTPTQFRRDGGIVPSMDFLIQR